MPPTVPTEYCCSTSALKLSLERSDNSSVELEFLDPSLCLKMDEICKRMLCANIVEAANQAAINKPWGASAVQQNRVGQKCTCTLLLAHLPEVPSFCPSFSSFPDKQCRFLLTQPHHRFNQGPAHAGTVTARIRQLCSPLSLQSERGDRHATPNAALFSPPSHHHRQSTQNTVQHT